MLCGQENGPLLAFTCCKRAFCYLLLLQISAILLLMSYNVWGSVCLSVSELHSLVRSLSSKHTVRRSQLVKSSQAVHALQHCQLVSGRA